MDTYQTRAICPKFYQQRAYIMPFIRVTHLVISLDEEIPVLLVLIRVGGLVH